MTSPSTSAGRGIVLYDGQCPMCQKSVAILKRLDWLGRLAYHDARDTGRLPAADVPLDSQKMLEEMHLLTPSRDRAYAGYRAFRWIAGRLPLAWAIWPLLFLPGVPWLGNRVYRWVAKNRYNLVPCHDGACAVPLKQPRATEQRHQSPSA
jgi:predicted DCC family thiol-disulfide oxidoreductase YuxK